MRVLNGCSALVAISIMACGTEALGAEPLQAEAAPPQPPVRQSVAACAWSHVTEADRQTILGAYHEASADGIEAHMGDFTRTLVSYDEGLSQAFAACDSNPDVPKMLAQEAMAVQALQAGAAAELEAARLVLRPHITRAGLDDAWAEAPAAAVQCIRADAGKSFGLKDLPCPDPKATFWFLRKFGLNPYVQSDKPVAAQILIFYHAKAQDEYIEAMLAHLDEVPTVKPQQ